MSHVLRQQLANGKDGALNPAHTNPPCVLTVVIYSDKIEKCSSGFGGRKEGSEEGTFMGMIGVTGQDEPNESKGYHMTPDYSPCPVTRLRRQMSAILR